MSIKISKGRKVLLYISIFLTSMAVIGEMGVVPVMYGIFNSYDFFIANYIASAAAFFVVLGSIVFTILMSKMSKKMLLAVACAIFAVSSIFCVIVDNPVYTCIMRSLMGVGEGGVNAVAMAYIAQLFIDEEKRASFMGYYNAAMTVAGIILSYGGGMLGAVEWKRAFNIYWPTVLMVIGILLFVPNIQDIEDQSQHPSGQTTGKKESLGLLYWTFVFDYMVFTLMYGLFSYFISTYVAETGIGGASFSGILNAATQVTGLIVALVFGVIYGKLRKNISIVCLIGMMAALIMFYIVSSTEIAIFASGIIGICYGCYYTYSYAYVTEIVPVSRIDDAIGYTTALYGLAFGISSFANSALMGFTGGSSVPLFLIWAVAGIIPLLIEILTTKTYKKRVSEMQE